MDGCDVVVRGAEVVVLVVVGGCVYERVCEGVLT